MKKINALWLLVFILFNPVFAKDNVKVKTITAFIQGKFSPSSQKSFIRIDKKYSNRTNLYMEKEAYKSFVSMRKAARKEGVKLTILSATRTFKQQKRIWEAKWIGSRKVAGKNLRLSTPDPVARARKILKYSSMPSTSRHHWGTDIDINSLSPAYFSRKKGRKEYLWLKNNAMKFGFCQPYTKKSKERRNGYNEEKWHWSYIPIAKKYTRYIKEQMNNQMIRGFAGSTTAVKIDVVDNYMLGVNKDCL